MSQGETEQSMFVVLNIGPAGDQLRVPPETLVELTRMVPPEGETPIAPVGITFKPAVDALFTPFCPRKMARCGISYVMPNREGTPVWPVPQGPSTSRPRGGKFLGPPL